MARHVEAERLLLLGEPLGVGQLGHVGQVHRAPRRAVAVAVAVGSGAWLGSSKMSKRPRWPRCDPPAWPARPGRAGAGSPGADWLRLARPGNRRRRPGSGSRRSRLPTSLADTRSKKSSRLVNGPALSRALTIASTALKPTPLIAPRPKWIFPSLATWNVELPLVDVRRQHLDPHPPAVVDMLDEELVALGAVHLRGEHGGHELGRVVGLQVGRLVGDQGIGGAVRLVEAVAAEEARSGRRSSSAWSSLQPALDRPLDELVAALGDDVGLLLRDRLDASRRPARARCRPGGSGSA